MTIPPKKFVGLHAHTSKSIFDGFGSVEDHFDFVLSNGGDGLAITDHGNMNAASDAFQKQTEFDKKGINFNAIYGVEAYFIDDLDKWREEKLARDEQKKEAKEAVVDSSEKEDSSGENEEETKNVSKKFDPINRRKHMVLLAKSQKGLKNLFRIVSKSNRDGFYRFPRVDMKMLREHGEDIVIGSACVGGVPGGHIFEEFAGIPQEELTPDLLDDPTKMGNIQKKFKSHFDELADAVGDENVFLELQFNKLPVQHMVNRALIEFAKNSKYKLISTADSHYNNPNLWRERELYKLIGRQMRGSKDGINPNMLPKNVDELKCELYPKNAEQMWASYQSVKGDMSFYDDQLVADSIERTWDIAHTLIGKVTPDTSIKLPSFGAPPGVDPFTLLVDKCKEGMRKRGLSGNKQYLDRLKRELIVIRDLGFVPYFLTLKAVFECVDNRVLFGCGRGSASASLVNYVLEITDVDPVANDLLFERFLSPARSKQDCADIDTDCSDRDELIAILRERFGTKTVVPISNYNQLQLKSLVKDISKLHDVPFDEVNQLTRKLDADVRPHMVSGDETKGAINLTYEACLEYSDEFKKFMEQYPAVALDVQALYQQPKAVGRHAGGIILLDDPDSEMPLISVRGEIQTPWSEGMNSKSLSVLGLIKYDFLGLKTLRMFVRTIKLILERHEGIQNPTNKQINDWYYTHITPSKINPEDQKVLKNVFHDGKWPGIFQFVNDGAQQFVQDIKPKNVTDIAIATAIFRPGPLAAHVDKLYIKALNENSSKDYGHPKVNEVLSASRGFIVFQEQISKIAIELSDFTPAEGEKLRKAILKRTTKGALSAKTETEILQEKFIDGAVRNGYSKESAEQLYEDMRAFAAYGFVRAHAVSYAYISYQCAWLFTYYPSEWLCAYAETMIGTPENRARMMSELKALGYSIAEVDINNSGHDWTISDDGKTFYPSFATVKGVGKIAVDEIIANRPYIEPTDIFWDQDRNWKTKKFNKRAISALIRTESFGSMGIVGPDKTFKSYAHMHHVIVDNSDRLRSKTKRDPDRNLRALQELVAADIPAWTIDERIQNKKDLIGYFDVSILLNPELLEKLFRHNLIDIGHFTKNGIYWFVVHAIAEKTTKTGKSYLILSLFDALGNTHKLTCWNASKDQVVLNKVCIAKITKDNWGFKTKIEDIRVIE